jgi:hypothetical protein
MDLIGLAELTPQLKQVLSTFRMLRVVASTYASKIHAALPPSQRAPTVGDSANILNVLAVFVPELKPLIPQIVQTEATIAKAISLIETQRAQPPSNAWPT